MSTPSTGQYAGKPLEAKVTAAKAIWAGVLGFVAPGATVLLIELAGDGIQTGDLWKALLTAVVTAAPSAGVVYAVQNRTRTAT
jgi:hypothetical protein